MSNYDIEQAAELAAQAFLRTKNIDWILPEEGIANAEDHIYCGLQGKETEAESGASRYMKKPCIVCACEQAIPVLPNYHGNWDSPLRIGVYSNADDTTGEIHALRVHEISNYFYTTTIAHDLSTAIPEFYVAKCTPGPRQRTIEGDCWVTWIEMSLYSACGDHIEE